MVSAYCLLTCCLRAVTSAINVVIPSTDGSKVRLASSDRFRNSASDSGDHASLAQSASLTELFLGVFFFFFFIQLLS